MFLISQSQFVFLVLVLLPPYVELWILGLIPVTCNHGLSLPCHVLSLMRLMLYGCDLSEVT